MNEKTKLKIATWFTVCYLIFAVISSLYYSNYEYLYYEWGMLIILSIVIFYYKKLQLSFYIIGGMSLMGLLHILGGNVFVNGLRLYDFWLIQNILRFDQVVHLVNTFITTVILYSLLYPHLDKKVEHNKLVLYLILVLMAVGIGAIYEIFEFGAVLFLGAAEKVGDYVNNLTDLVFDLLGSVIACYFVIRYHKKSFKKN